MTSPPPSDDAPETSESAEKPAPAEGWAPLEAPQEEPAASSIEGPAHPAGAVAAAPPPPMPVVPGTLQKTNRLAIVALVTGLFGLLVLAVGFGIAAFVQISRRADEKGKGLAIGGIVAGLAWTAFAIVIALVMAATSLFTAERDASGRITESGKIIPEMLRVGDCFNGWDMDLPEADPLVTVTPCTKPHQGEIAAKTELADGPWPGQERAYQLALDACELKTTRFLKSRHWDQLEI